MPLDESKIPVTTAEQKRKVGRAAEPVTIDKSTFELKGVNTGTVFGKGANLQEALALQTKLQSGSAPTVAGRPDLLAVEQTKGIAVEPIIGANGQPVAPRVATPDELAQASAGTLPSFNKVTGTNLSATPVATGAQAGLPATSTAPLPPTDFASAMKEATSLGAKAGVDAMLTAPSGFDNQILMKKSVLVNALLGERLTPEDLRDRKSTRLNS